MAFGDLIDTGTVSLDPDHTDRLIGDGTLWLTTARLGDQYEINGLSVTILSVQDDAHLTLKYEWPGSSFTDALGILKQVAPSRYSALEIASSLADIRQRLRIFDDAKPVFSIVAFGVEEIPEDAVVGDFFVASAMPDPGESLASHANEIIEVTETGFNSFIPEHGWFVVDQVANSIRSWLGSAWSGAVGLHPAGEWSAIVTYNEKDVVSKNGSSFISRQEDNLNNNPETETEFWMVNSAKGEAGTTVIPDHTVRVMSATDTDPSGSDFAAGEVIDGVTLVAGDSVFRNASGHPERNGIWIAPASGAAARDESYDAFDDYPGQIVTVQEGDDWAESVWQCTSDKGGTLDTTAINWKQVNALATTTLPGIVELATAAEVRSAATGGKAVDASLIETASAYVALTDAAPVAVDWDSFINGSVTITADRQIGNPTNGQPGTYRTILVQGNNSTDRAITFGNQFLGDVPTIVDCDSGKWYDLTLKCITATHFTVVSQVAKKP